MCKAVRFRKYVLALCQIIERRVCQDLFGWKQEGLKSLWEHAFPGVPWQGVQADKWVDMGWQRNDPSSDFRGAGLIALHNHLHMAQVSTYFKMPLELCRITVRTPIKATTHGFS